MMVGMGQVIDLAAARARRRPLAAAMERLEGAIGRIDPLVRRQGDRLSPTIAAELRTISEAVRAGNPERATRLAERLADRLEHPAALGS
jgi:DNA-binding FadR family transcriptional regulator